MAFEKELATMMQNGLTISDCIIAFAKLNTENDLSLIELARDQHHQDGEVEIDDFTVVSIPADNETGAYVLAWVWAERN